MIPQFIKQIAERQLLAPGVLLRIEPTATAAGVTHLLVLGKDEFENIILLPGMSRSDLLTATGDVHCWVIPQEELESLDPVYDGKIPDALRLLSIEAQAITAPKYAPGDTINANVHGVTYKWAIEEVALNRDGYQYYVRSNAGKDDWYSEKLLDLQGVAQSGDRLPMPKFGIGQTVSANIDDKWMNVRVSHIRWTNLALGVDDLLAYLDQNKDQWLYSVDVPGVSERTRLPESKLVPITSGAPEIQGEEDIVIAQSQPKKLTYDPENPGQYFYLERPKEEAPAATPVEEDKIPEYLYERQLQVHKGVPPATPVMQELREDLKDPDRMIKALAIHIHELEKLRTDISKFSENVNAAMDYARRGLEQVQVNDTTMNLREVAPFKHRDPGGNLLRTPKWREEWVRARQALTILDKVRSGLETTDLMVVSYRDVVYELRKETELIMRASQHVADPKVVGFRDWAMTYNEFARWWDDKRIAQNRQVKNVQAALRAAWKRYREKHAFFYRRILTRYGRLVKKFIKALKRIGTNARWPIPPFTVGIRVKKKFGDAEFINMFENTRTVDEMWPMPDGQGWYFRDADDGNTYGADLWEPYRQEDAVPPPPMAFNYGSVVRMDNFNFSNGEFIGVVYGVTLSKHRNRSAEYYYRLYRGSIEELEGSPDPHSHATAWQFDLRPFVADSAPKILGEEDIVIAQKLPFKVGDVVYSFMRPHPGKIIEVLVDTNLSQTGNPLFKVQYPEGAIWHDPQRISKTEPLYQFDNWVQWGTEEGIVIGASWSEGQWLYDVMLPKTRDQINVFEKNLKPRPQQNPELSSEEDILIARHMKRRLARRALLRRAQVEYQFKVGDQLYLGDDQIVMVNDKATFPKDAQAGQPCVVTALIPTEDGNWPEYQVQIVADRQIGTSEGNEGLIIDRMIDGRFFEVTEDELTDQKPQYEIGEDDLQVDSSPHEMIEIRDREWKDEWVYQAWSEESGDLYEISEDDIEDFEEEEEVDIYVTFLGTSDYQDMAIDVSSEMPNHNHSDLKEPYVVYKYGPLPKSYADEMDLDLENIGRSIDLSRGILVYEADWSDVLGDASYAEDDVVQYDADKKLYRVEKVYGGREESSGESTWLYNLQVIDPLEYPVLAGHLGIESPTDGGYGIGEDYLTEVDIDEYAEEVMSDMSSAPQISGEDDIVLAKRKAQLRMLGIDSVVTPNPNIERAPDFTISKMRLDADGDFWYCLDPGTSKLYREHWIPAANISKEEQIVYATNFVAPKFGVGSRVAVDNHPSGLVTSAFTADPKYRASWVYQVNFGDYTLSVEEGDLKAVFEAPQITGEEDIVVAQQETFDELEWLSQVETDVEEFVSELEMMSDFFNQASEIQTNLSTKREVYEANYGEVPGDPAVVDIPMAAAAQLIYYATNYKDDDFLDAEPMLLKSARLADIEGDKLTVVDGEGKTHLVARGMVVISQAEKIRRRRKRRKIQPIETIEETEPTDLFGKPQKKVRVPKRQPEKAPSEEIQLVPMPSRRPDVPEGQLPVDTPPEELGPEPLQPMPVQPQQPVAPVMAPIQLIQQAPPPPPSPAPPPVPAPEEMDVVDFTDIPDEEWRNLTNAEKIRMGAVFNRIIIIEYEKVTAPETGVIKSYQVEPYSYRVKRPQRTGGSPVWYLFAHDVIDNHIKAFIVRNIKDVEIIDQKFAPRWDVEFTYNPRWEKHRKKTTKPGAPPSEVELTEEGFDL